MHPPRIPLAADDLVLSDFDGTISVVDTCLAMIDTLSPEDAAQVWADEKIWRRREIDSMECLRRQWSLFRKTPAEVWEFVDGLALDESFFDFLSLVRERNAGIAVLSDGLSFYLDRTFERHGLPICTDDACVRSRACLLRFTNTSHVTETGLELEFPYRGGCLQCGNCKATHLERLRQGFQRVIYIGDGHSDLCAARYADVIFAKHALADDCLQSGRPFHPFETFSDVLDVLR